MHAAPQPATFRGLWDQHHGYVWAVLRRFGVPEHDAEDLLQDVFVVVHRRWSDFEGRSSMTTWLYGIATRVYWNYARRERGRPRMVEISASSWPIAADLETCPQRAVERQQAGAMLERLLGDLDPPKRTAYVLSELEELTAAQISAITGVKERTIYSRVRAAKVQIAAAAQRVRAREAGDEAVRRLARAATARPPPEVRRRAWVSLLARLPSSASPVLPWGGPALVAIPAGVGLGVTALAVAWGLRGDPGPAPAPVTRAVEAAVDDTRRPSTTPASSPSPEPRAMPSVEVAAASPPVSPVLESAHAKAPPKAEAGTPPKQHDPPAPEIDDRVGEDLVLLQRARAALRSDDPSRALKLLDEHARRFSSSALAPERDKTRLVALCRANRPEDARLLAEQLRVGLPPSCAQ